MALALSRSRTVIRVGSLERPDEARELTRGTAPRLSPDGRTVYFIGEGPEQVGLFAMPVSGGAPVRLAATRPVNGFDLSPDGRRLTYFVKDGNQIDVVTLPAAGGAPRVLAGRIMAPGVTPLYPPRWSPDGSQIAYANDKTLFTIPAAGGQPRRLAQMYEWEEWLWAPDGRSIAALAYAAPKDIAAFLIPAEDGVEPRRLSPSAERGYKEGLAWHPDGTRLAYVLYVEPDERESGFARPLLTGARVARSCTSRTIGSTSAGGHRTGGSSCT